MLPIKRFLSLDLEDQKSSVEDTRNITKFFVIVQSCANRQFTTGVCIPHRMGGKCVQSIANLNLCLSVPIIDLVLIDRQSVGKRNLHLNDTVNAKKRWTTKTTIYWRVNKFSKESHVVTSLAKERASFLKIDEINDILLLDHLTVIIVIL
jgi:hypothetical protein